MKARVKTSIVKQELALIYDELYDKFASDLTKNVTAAIFVVLAREYGLGREQLLALQKSIEEHFRFMELPFPGKPYTTSTDREWLKSNLDIDLDKSMLWKNK